MKILTLTLGMLFTVTSILSAQHAWKDIAVIENLEVYTDTTSIEIKDNYCYAWVKTTYTTDESQKGYVDKIRNSYSKQDKKLEKKMKKWKNFYYNISYRMYDCVNGRYAILEVTDYSANHKKIIKTKTEKKKIKWVNAGTDTMADYTLYYICDYNSQ